MELINEQKEIINTPYDPALTEGEFIRLLLLYLYNRGIKVIDENELAKKLFPYFKNEKYKPLFIDLTKDCYENKVNITNAMYREKYFSNNIIWLSNKPESLHLAYGKDFDATSYEKGIDPRLLELLNSIANDFGVRNEIETSILNVYGYNPNKRYSLISAQSFGNYQSELITDGDIKKEQSSSLLYDVMTVAPIQKSTYRSYKNGISRTVSIKNSSFVVIRGICDDEIQRIGVFTRITDLEKLLQIKEIAEKKYDNQESLLLENKPFVRKLVLK